MSRYIDADELLKRLPEDLPYKASVKRVLMQAPDVDAVAVVKCTHCKYCKYDTYWHELYCDKMSDDEHTHWVPVGFYCGYGEELEDD